MEKTQILIEEWEQENARYRLHPFGTRIACLKNRYAELEKSRDKILDSLKVQLDPRD